MRHKLVLSLLSLITIFSLVGQSNIEVNYDESKVPHFNLPEILVGCGGEKIETAEEWEKYRKPEIRALFSSLVYGHVPQELKISKIKVREQADNVFNDLAVRKQVDLIFKKDTREVSISLLMYLPKMKTKVPVFLGLNFYGNQSITDDPKVFITKSWVRDREGVVKNRATEALRGINKHRWPVEMIIREGFGVVTAYCGDIDPDRDNFQDGIQPFFYAKGQTRPKPDEWGTIAAWSWGLSRIMDYLALDRQIDADKVIVIGHSRLGKAAIWAAANDERFAACVSNNSGCMGAALSRRKFGETVEIINTKFPHWFCENLKNYNEHEEMLPVDQHALLAMIAPRPLYVASATEDTWADPKGEFLAAKEASKVYELYGKLGLRNTEMPLPDTPLFGTVSYHIRTGKHDTTELDWLQYLKFAKTEIMGNGAGKR